MRPTDQPLLSAAEREAIAGGSWFAVRADVIRKERGSLVVRDRKVLEQLVAH